MKNEGTQDTVFIHSKIHIQWPTVLLSSSPLSLYTVYMNDINARFYLKLSSVFSFVAWIFLCFFVLFYF